MKLLTIQKDKEESLAVKLEEGIIDLVAALELFPDEHVPVKMMDLIRGGDLAMTRLKDYVNSLDLKNKPYLYNEADLTYGPVVSNPEKIICVGLNYKKHADETKLPYPETPILFNKFANALTGHLQDVVIPDTTERLDYEVELAIVIGKEAKQVSEEEALDFVFGYSTANDLSARDLQKRTSQWMLGKTHDGFAPIGPYLVTKEHIEDPNNLGLRTKFNGETVQDSNTRDMIFTCEEIISYISHHMTLKAGDIILTGTPEGVIIGKPIKERVYIKPGDEVTVEVEALGELTTGFIEEN